ncbi:MAG: phosphotransferase [Acidimicrobiales bacterium]
MEPPGRLLASGRDADIFEYGPGLVLRRSRAGRSMQAEARIMEFVRHHGYPVPAVDELSGDGLDLVLERVDGVTMAEELRRRPWTVRRQGVALSELHRRLHQIPAPPFLPPAPVGEGDRVLHMDLHPLNVMVGPTGPVVIDWANAAAGEAAVDVALAWVLIRAGQLPDWQPAAAVEGALRSVVLGGFLRGVDRVAVKAVAPAVVEWKARDPHLSERERSDMRRAVTRL